MPEIAVGEDDKPFSGENKIRVALQLDVAAPA
jgi:hypothetical protein